MLKAGFEPAAFYSAVQSSNHKTNETWLIWKVVFDDLMENEGKITVFAIKNRHSSNTFWSLQHGVKKL